jgi:hypothetical protein
MPALGTRRFWRPIGAAKDATPPQVLKLQGYVSVVLHAAHYRSGGGFWQRIFGGADQITLVSEVSYYYGAERITAAAVQDARRVRARREHYLGIGRIVALKVPADADGLQLDVSIAAVENDRLQRALDLLNADEFKVPLELAPPVVGQVLAVTRMVKRLLDDASPEKRLEASYAGIISREATADPLETGRLVAGYLILISANDDDEGILASLDPAKLAVRGDGLVYAGRPVRSTYVVYAVTVDRLRGVNVHSSWYRKLRDALNRLDDMDRTAEEEWPRIYDAALDLWTQGRVLLDEDQTYLPSERRSIQLANLKEIRERYSAQQEARAGAAFAAGAEVRVQDLLADRAGRLARGVEYAEMTLAELNAEVDAYAGALGEAGLTLSWDL